MFFWKLVFWLSAVFFVIQLISIPFGISASAEGLYIFIDLLLFIFTGISLIPLYGYSHQTLIGSKAISTVIFSINAVFYVLGLGYFLVTRDASSFDFVGFVIVLLGVSLPLLHLYPQYRYAFSSPHIWGAKNA